MSFIFCLLRDFGLEGKGNRVSCCSMYGSHNGTKTFTCIHTVHGSFTNTPRVFMI